MAEIHHLEAKDVDSTAGVSAPKLSQAHNLKAEGIESATEVSAPKLSEVIEKIQLTDKVSEEERVQMLRWVKEHFEEILESIQKIDEVVQSSELPEFMSSDAVQFLIELLQNLH